MPFTKRQFMKTRFRQTCTAASLIPLKCRLFCGPLTGNKATGNQ